ncbi:MAG: hypothetical protein VW443_04790 [Pseudomonadales bacterium]|jgi:hypothetical protein
MNLDIEKVIRHIEQMEKDLQAAKAKIDVQERHLVEWKELVATALKVGA